MLTATRQRRITYILVGVTALYLVLLFRTKLQDASLHFKNQQGNTMNSFTSYITTRLGWNSETTIDEVIESPVLYKPECNALFHDDQTEMVRTTTYLQDNEQKITPNAYYIKATQVCEKFVREHNFTESYSQIPLQFPTAYIITAHTSVQQFEILMHAIYNEHNVYCVHVHNEDDPVYRQAMEALVNCLPSVFISTKSETMIKYDHSELRAELHCMRDLLTLPIHWRYVVNLDEHSFPLKTNTQFTDRLKDLGDYNMVTGRVSISDDLMVRYKYSHVIANGRLTQTQNLKSPPPSTIQLRHGSPYYVLTRNFVQFIMSNYYSLEFVNWLNDTYSPRELYWASMNHMYLTTQNMKPPTGGLAAQETHYYKLRSQASGQVADDSECPGRYMHNYCTFGMKALSTLVNRHELFAKRFDINLDHIPVVCLDEHITNPYHGMDNNQTARRVK